VEATNQAEAMIDSTKKQLSEHGSNPLVASAKGEVEKAIAETESAIATEDSEKIKAATATLAQVAMKIGEAIYSAAQASAGADDAPGGKGAPGDGIVDAEFEEVKDDKGKKKSA
jgi:molecular chaperone DnaK